MDLKKGFCLSAIYVENLTPKTAVVPALDLIKLKNKWGKNNNIYVKNYYIHNQGQLKDTEKSMAYDKFLKKNQQRYSAEICKNKSGYI